STTVGIVDGLRRRRPPAGNRQSVEPNRVDGRRRDRMVGVVREGIRPVVAEEVAADPADQRWVGALRQAGLAPREAAVDVDARLEGQHRRIGGDRDVGPLGDPDVVASGGALHRRMGRVEGVRPTGSVVVAGGIGIDVDRLTPATGIGRDRAVVLVPVIVELVAVVARLLALPQDSVTADRYDTGVEAAVGVDVVAIVALLAGGGVQEPITTFSIRALGSARGVCTIAVAVVALFARLQDVVPATGQRACIRTPVVVDGVVIVAFLPGLYEPITATGESAHVRALVCVAHVAVVAAFTGPLKTIATDVVGAVGLARGTVGVRHPVVALLDASLNQTIATFCEVTREGACGIVGVVVAVVALLSRLNVAIPTLGQRAQRRTFVCIDVVPIVARLAHLHDPVAATLELAARAATVAIDGVAVIAAFTGPFEPVATDIVQTGLEAC